MRARSAGYRGMRLRMCGSAMCGSCGRGSAPAGIEQVVPPELEYQYPEPGMFGVMPAYGFYPACEGDNADERGHELHGEGYAAAVLAVGRAGRGFFQHQGQREEGVPAFMLKNVEQFRTHEVRGMADMVKEKVEAGKF